MQTGAVCVSACISSSHYVCADTHTRVQVCVLGGDQHKLTCSGFDELVSLFNPSPPISHMLGNCQYCL